MKMMSSNNNVFSKMDLLDNAERLFMEIKPNVRSVFLTTIWPMENVLEQLLIRNWLLITERKNQLVQFFPFLLLYFYWHFDNELLVKKIFTY